MSWAAYLVLLKLASFNWCHSLFVQYEPIGFCAETVFDCTLDEGEGSFDFCTMLYLEDKDEKARLLYVSRSESDAR